MTVGGVELLAIGVTLICVPTFVAGRFPLRAKQMRFLSLVSVLAGAGFVVATFVVCGAASVEDLTARSPEATNRTFAHIVPSIPLLGWLSLGMTITIAIGMTRVTTTARRRRNSLRDRLLFAEIDYSGGVPVAVLPTHEDIAVAVPGPSAMVVVSLGIRQRLQREEYEAVLAHERAHLRLGHHRDLLTARALRDSLWFVPGIGSAVRTLHNSIECEADESASAEVGHDATRRAMSRLHVPGRAGPTPTGSAGGISRTASYLGIGASWATVAFTTIIGLMIAATWIG